MKICLLFSVFTVVSLWTCPAQSTNASSISATNEIGAAGGKSVTTNSPANLAPPPFTTELTRPFAPANLAPLEPKPNEIRIGNVQASGIAIEAAKTGNPLRLINPFNPPTNSSPEDNVVRDPFNGKVNGLSVFTIRF